MGAHDRGAFACGNSDLDRYFRQIVTQDIRRGAATAFVAVDSSSGEVAGFYTLSATSVERNDLPAHSAARAPRYAKIPTVLIGRLAVALSHQGKGLGGTLVADAARRAFASGVGVHLLAVEPKDGLARAFYVNWGFEPLLDPNGPLYVPLGALVDLLD